MNSIQQRTKIASVAGLIEGREKPGLGVSLFFREFGRTAAYYANSSFVPNYKREPSEFLPPNRTTDIERASELCGESYQCRYDYGMSLNREMAFFTKIYYDHAVNIRALNSRRVISCGVLETPRFGRKLSFLFTPGSQVGFECNKGFVLTGDRRRTCTAAGRWDAPVSGYTLCLREYTSLTFIRYIWSALILNSNKISRITGEVYYTRRSGFIATGIVVVAIAPILMCIVCALYWYRKRARAADPDWKPSLPRSRASSKANLHFDGSEADSDTLKKSRSYEKVYRTHEPLEGKPNIDFPEKKWDLDEEDLDVTSSEGGPDSSGQGKLARDINYISTAGPDDIDADTQERQTGRRTQRNQLQTQVPSPIEEASYRATPVESPTSSYSLTYSFGQSPVLSDRSPVLTQTVGLPTALPNRSTEV